MFFKIGSGSTDGRIRIRFLSRASERDPCQLQPDPQPWKLCLASGRFEIGTRPSLISRKYNTRVHPDIWSLEKSGYRTWLENNIGLKTG